MFNCIATRCSALCVLTTATIGTAAAATGHTTTAAVFAAGLTAQVAIGIYSRMHSRHYANPHNFPPAGRSEYRCREALLRIAAPPILAMSTIGAACFVYEPSDPEVRLIVASAATPQPFAGKAAPQ